MKRSVASLTAFLIAACVGVVVHQFVLKGGNLTAQVKEETATPVRPPLEVITKATTELAGLAEANVTLRTSEQAAGLLNEIESAFAAIKQGEGADEADIRQARYSLLTARYVAVTIDRSRFAKPFHEFVQQLIVAKPSGDEARKAEMLQVLARHDLRRPVERRFLEDIQRFAADHTPNQTASLYCLASQELVRHDQRDAANSLLQHGIKTYQSVPSVTSRLVNQSASLELKKPPQPKYTQANYDALLRSYETRAKAAGGSPRRT